VKVIQFVHGYPPEFIGGTESYSRALSQRLARRGHSCLVIAGSERPWPEPSVALSEDEGVDVARLVGPWRRKGLRPVSYDPVVEGLIRKLLAWWCPEIVHVHHWSRLTNNIVAVCRELGIPVVVTLHDQWIACSRHHRVRPDEGFCADRSAPCASCVDRDPWQPIEEVERELALRERAIQQELELADRLLVPSRAQQAFLHTIAGLPLERLEVMPLGSPREQPGEIGDEQPRSTSGPLKVGHWGYLLPEKGLHLLLEAARRIPKGMAVEWHIYGKAPDPAYEARLAKLAEGLPVVFHGDYTFRDLVSARLDLAVFPSLCCETYSFVLDEAFMLTVPVLAADRGAFPERVGNAGFLFRCGDADDLAAKLRSLLERPEALRRLEQEATVERVVSMEDHVSQIGKIYQEVVDSYAPGTAPEQDHRALLLHQHRQVIDRDREIERLQRVLADVRVETEAETARLLHTIETLGEEREWWRKQTRQLGGELDRLEKSSVFKVYKLLSRLKSSHPPGEEPDA
jgi:glycosyltransferase involved in cell wall biosynthesis